MGNFKDAIIGARNVSVASVYERGIFENRAGWEDWLKRI